MAAEGGGGQETFEARVKRLFGSGLYDAVPGSSFPAAPWSVASGNVEGHRWARPSEARDEEEAADRGDTPCASAFYDANGCLRARRRRPRQDFEDDLGELGKDDEDEDEDERGKTAEEDEEEGVRASIGLDPTLDREEEEDNYDREAFGKEDAADRVYMKDVMDDGINMSINSIVPDLLDDSIEKAYRFSKDPRADIRAASARLREDDDSAKDSDSHYCTIGMEAKKAEEDISVKPILKRKEEQIDAKPRKRVRFDASVKDPEPDIPEHDGDSSMVPQTMDVVKEKENTSTPSESPGIPDYVKNPSKYTRYALDSADCNDESNRRALADLHDLLGRSDPNKTHEAHVEIPSYVTFIPRKKSVDAMAVDEGSKTSDPNSSAIGMMARGSDETDQCEMDEDDIKASAPLPVHAKASTRRYRASRIVDDDECK